MGKIEGEKEKCERRLSQREVTVSQMTISAFFFLPEGQRMERK